MADFKYIMQGFQKDINFFDEIKEVLEQVFDGGMFRIC